VAFRKAADTQGRENAVLHHLAAIEMRKRNLPLGRRTRLHRAPVIINALEVDANTLDAPADVAKNFTPEMLVTTVLNYDGATVRVVNMEKEKEIAVGDFVSWNSSGGTARGQVERIVRTGSIDVPDSSFTINAEPDDPAMLIRLWRVTSAGNEQTDTLVGHKMKTTRRIPALTETVNKTIRQEDGQWCVYSADGSRSFGCYSSEAQAEARLKQIEAFKSVDKAEGVKPPASVRAAARRAVKWIEEGKAGKGFTPTGRRRASQLAAGESVSPDTIRRMRSFFARHEVDRSAKGFKQGQEGFPSPGRVAWDAWGGDAGRSWANQQFRRQEANKARPENPWKRGYNTEYFAARDEILAKGPKCVMCKKKKATEVDHIKSLKDGGSNAKSNLRPVCASCNRQDGGGERADASKRYISKAVAEKRYTLGPMYIPNAIDAQNEWTDEEELQQAVWKYVRSGDRRIRLQHNRDVVAGEWVECMAWPYEVSVPMMSSDGTADVTEFPPNTVFLGVVWEPWAWDMVKAGSLRGYSIGGAAARVLADLPEAVDSVA